MKSASWLVPVGVLVIGAAVYAVAAAVVAPGARTGALVGVAVAVAFQLLLFGLARAVFARNPLAAYGVGLLGRLLLVIVSALVLVPAAGLPAMPTLFSLVSVLFATTLLEPVALASGTPKKS